MPTQLIPGERYRIDPSADPDRYCDEARYADYLVHTSRCGCGDPGCRVDYFEAWTNGRCTSDSVMIYSGAVIPLDNSPEARLRRMTCQMVSTRPPAGVRRAEVKPLNLP